MVFACASMPTRPGLPLCLAGIEMFRKVSRPIGPSFGQSNHPRPQRCALPSVEDTCVAAVEDASEDDTHTSALPSHSNTSGGVRTPQGLSALERDESGRTAAAQEPRVSSRKHMSFKVDESRRGRGAGGADIAVPTGRATAAIPIRARRGEAMEEAVLAVEAARYGSADYAESDDGAGQGADVGGEGGEGGEEEGDVEGEVEEEEEEEDTDLWLQHRRSLNNEIAYWDSLRIHLQRRSHPQPGLLLGWPSPPSSPPDHSGRALDIIRAAIIDDAVDGEEWKAWGAKAA